MAINNTIKAGCLFLVIVWALYGTTLNNTEEQMYEYGGGGGPRKERAAYRSPPGWGGGTYEFAQAQTGGGSGWDSR